MVVTLSDDKPCDVRKLGLYELDHVDWPKVWGPFTYKRQIAGGNEYEFEYDIARLKKPPEMPGVPESSVKEKSEAWYDWREYNLYQAAVSYERQRMEANADYLDRVAQYILHNCIDKVDIKRILTVEDWKIVYSAAIVQQLTKQKIVETLRQFRATYSHKELFDALAEAAGGRGEYDAIRVWEGKLMIKMGVTEADYSLISVDERARKVVADNIENWVGFLESDRMKKEMDAQK